MWERPHKLFPRRDFREALLDFTKLSGLVLNTRQYFCSENICSVVCPSCERQRLFFRCVRYISLLYCSEIKHEGKLCVVFPDAVGISSIRDIVEVDQET